MPRLLDNPLLGIPLVMWEGCMAVAGNVVQAIRLYHEVAAEILELIQP